MQTNSALSQTSTIKNTTIAIKTCEFFRFKFVWRGSRLDVYGRTRVWLFPLKPECEFDLQLDCGASAYFFFLERALSQEKEKLRRGGVSLRRTGVCIPPAGVGEGPVGLLFPNPDPIWSGQEMGTWATKCTACIELIWIESLVTDAPTGMNES